MIAATHSEVLIDATAPERVLAFVGDSPRLIAHKSERDQIRQALKLVSTVDQLRAHEAGAVLYLEGSSDENILREWALVLDHPARRFLESGYVHHLDGGRAKDANDHLFALRGHCPAVRALCILDGDMRGQPERQTEESGLQIFRWRRYEIENYLTPKRMADLADGLEDAIAKMEQWGIPVRGGSRLTNALRLLRGVASANAFPEARGTLIAVPHAARDAQELTEIGHVLPDRPLDPVAEALRRVAGGTLGQSPHRAYQSQSELWVGAMLARAGAFTGVIKDPKDKSPDYVVRNGNMEYSVEVKRPASLAKARTLVSGAATQLLSRRYHGGALVVDLTDCLDPDLAACAAPGPPDLRRVQEQIHAYMDRLRKRGL